MASVGKDMRLSVYRVIITDLHQGSCELLNGGAMEASDCKAFLELMQGVARVV